MLQGPSTTNSPSRAATGSRPPAPVSPSTGPDPRYRSAPASSPSPPAIYGSQAVYGGSGPPTPQARPATPVVNARPFQAQADLDRAYGLRNVLTASDTLRAQSLANQISGINASVGIDNAYLNQLQGFAGQRYNIANQLNAESRYRDVDLGRQRVAEDRRYISTTWSNLKDFINKNRTNAWQVLNQQAEDFNQGVVFNQRGKDLGLGQAMLARTRRDQALTRDAMARGARGSRGYEQDMGNSRTEFDLDSEKVNLDFDKTQQSLRSSWSMANLNYQHTLDQLNYQWGQGENSYIHGMSGVNITSATLDSLARGYALQAQQNQVQYQQEIAGYQHQALANQQGAANQIQSLQNQNAQQWLAQVMAALG